MAGTYTSVKVAYDGRSVDILLWCITTVLFSLITLGLYLPVAMNRLVRYIFDNTELQIMESAGATQDEGVAD